MLQETYISEAQRRKEEAKAKYIRHCSNAKLAAMYLNGEITDDEYFSEIARR